MRFQDLVAPPPSQPVSVRWDRPADDVAASLHVALSERRFVDPGREQRPFYRPDGAVFGRTVSVRLTPHLLPDVPPGRQFPPFVVGGDLRDADGGAILDGWLTASRPTPWRWADLVWIIGSFVFIVPDSGLLPWLVVVAFGLAAVTVWDRWQARKRLRRVTEIEDVLAGI